VAGKHWYYGSGETMLPMLRNVWEMEVDENENVYRFLSTDERAK
jgi:hypothetical protein